MNPRLRDILDPRAPGLLLAIVWGAAQPVSAGPPAGGTAQPGRQVVLWGGYHIFADKELRDVYGGCPEVGGTLRTGLAPKVRVDLSGAVRWASSALDRAPFLSSAEGAWLSVPVDLSVVASASEAPVRPYGRLGGRLQWSRERLDTEVGGDRLRRQGSQWNVGLVVGAGLASARGGADWTAGVSWSWIPADRLVLRPDDERHDEEMNLGGVSLTFGVAFP